MYVSPFLPGWASSLITSGQPWAPAIAMFAGYMILFFEVAANRVSTRRLGRIGLLSRKHFSCIANLPDNLACVKMSSAPQSLSSFVSYQTTATQRAARPECDTNPPDSSLDISYDPFTREGIAQLIAIAILEFGILSHSVIIGLTLGISDEFVTLFVALVLHQMFRGLGLGSRL